MNNIDHRPIVIPKATIDKILTLPIKDRSNALALYTFYYYTSVWQKTNQPYCTDSFVSGKRNTTNRKGFGWGTGKTSRVRKLLTKLKLIQRIKTKSGKSYIDVIYYQGKQSTQLAKLREELTLLQYENTELKSQLAILGSRPTRDFCNSLFQRVNAYSNNKKKNTYNNNTVSAKNAEDGTRPFGTELKKSFFKIAAIKLCKVVEKKRQQKGRISINQWESEFRKLYNIDNISKKQIKVIIKWYIKHHQDQYTPQIYHARDIRQKWSQLEAATQRYIQETTSIEDDRIELTERTYVDPKTGKTITEMTSFNPNEK